MQAMRSLAVKLLAGLLMLAAGGHVTASATDLLPAFEQHPVIEEVPLDLYEVTLGSREEARWLRNSSLIPLVRVGNEYLVACDGAGVAELQTLDLKHDLILDAVSLDELALDRLTDRRNVDRYELIYENGALRLFRVGSAELRDGQLEGSLLPVERLPVKILYTEPPAPPVFRTPAEIDFDSLISLVEQDTIVAYMDRLQAFNGRVAGTDSAIAARDWIYSKFEEYGLDSVYVDPFVVDLDEVPTQCWNVVGVRVGTVYPDVRIIVGGHYDGVPGSPAADDNGSGTTGVLELARILSGLTTDMTLVFVTFDAEERGLHGAWHYAGRAATTGEQIMLMLNMDMIGDINNVDSATLFAGSSSMLAPVWLHLADSLVGLKGYIPGISGGSDHYPFYQWGFDASFLHEHEFSDYWHTSSDSTTYINYDYMIRMVKSALATVYHFATSDDVDGDGILNGVDNCMFIANSSQDNGDADSHGDVCDNCPSTSNEDQLDWDMDDVGDLCDACPQDSLNDTDYDGLCADVDNCPFFPNALQTDTDGDGVGDVCQCTEPYYTFTGSYLNMLGFALDGAGDVDADGYEDIIVGAYYTGSQRGKVYVYSGADGSVLYLKSGEAAGDMFGAAVAGVTDVNKDGHDDFAVGAMGYSGEAPGGGRVYVYSGLNGSVIWTHEGSGMGGTLGSSLETVGDLNGDTICDLLVGEMYYGLPGVGHAYVYSGDDGSIIHAVQGEMVEDWFGITGTAAGDVNGDEVPDFAVSATRNSEAATKAGKVYLYSGADASIIRTFLGAAAGDVIGAKGAMGDITLDGVPELLIGGPQSGDEGSEIGYASIYDGADGSLIRTHQGNPGSRFGWYSTGVGDANGDGWPDYAVGAPHENHVYVFSGLDGSLLLGFRGEGVGDRFGYRLSSGDCNNDSAIDLMVGAHYNRAGGYAAGRAYVYLLGDADQDGAYNPCDNCLVLPNPLQDDADGDEFGDVCDNCPGLANQDQVDTDSDGSGDACDCCWWATGNVDYDMADIVDIGDLTALIDFLFISYEEPACMAEANVDGDTGGVIDIGDLTALIDYLFISYDPPADCL
ncbi:MAG: M28 family peptidase [Candidatus Zixiibacteriota bacterium]|nr:MAG: M28 family peptidase [candidate division Zixibacteria bacterium]